MAEDGRILYPSIPLVNDSSELNSESFDTSYSNSSVIGGASSEYMISLSNNDNYEGASKSVIFEIPAGNDIVQPIIEYACRRRVGIVVLSGSGFVSDVTLLHPMSHIAPALSITGNFNIVSFTGTYMGGHFPPLSSPTPACSSFVINLSGFPSQVFCGIVGGRVIAASRVVVVASTFKKFEYHIVPGIAEEVEEGDPANVATINADASDANGITNNTDIAVTNNMSSFSITNLTSLNHQLPFP